MPMSRTGKLSLSSLMGYAPGGAVDLADITLGFNSFSDKEKAKRKSYEKDARDLASKISQ
jgi:hypothetical protein